MTQISDYGCGPRAVLVTDLDEDDLMISPHRIPAGGLNLVRPVELSIKIFPSYDATAGDWEENATSDNPLFDVQIDLSCTMGKASDTDDKKEEWEANGMGYFNFKLSDIPLKDFDIDCSAWTTENLIKKVLYYAVNHVDTTDIQGADPDTAPTANTYVVEEDTPAP